MGIIVSIAALLLSSSAAYAQTPQVERILFTEYGIYTVDRDVQGRDVLGINRAAASNVRHAATLRTIPAQIGTTFGFRYKVIGRPHAAWVELRQVVIFPSPGIIPSSSSKPITQDEFVLQTRIGETSYAFLYAGGCLRARAWKLGFRDLAGQSQAGYTEFQNRRRDFQSRKRVQRV